MQIIVKKAFQFNDYEYSTHPRNGETVSKLIQTLKAFPSMRPQAAPDWIVNDDLFDIALADGSLVAIGEVPARTAKQSTPEPQQAAQPTAEQTEEQKQAEQAALMEVLNTPIALLTGGFPAPGNYPTRPDGFPRQSDAR